MKYYIIVLLLCPLFNIAQNLEWSGTIGNSGEKGKTLIHAALGRGGGGVFVDGQGRIFTGGGDRILVLDKDGKSLWATVLPVVPENTRYNYYLGGPSFAVAGGYLYFLAGEAKPFSENRTFFAPAYNLIHPNVMRMDMTPGAEAELVTKNDRFTFDDWLDVEFSLTSNVKKDSVFLGVRTHSTAPQNYTVFEIDPEMNICTPRYTWPIGGYRIAGDEAGCIYFGGANGVRKIDLNGRPMANYNNIALPRTGETQDWGGQFFTGSVMLSQDALWLMARFGYLGRFTRDMQPAPTIR